MSKRSANILSSIYQKKIDKELLNAVSKLKVAHPDREDAKSYLEEQTETIKAILAKGANGNVKDDEGFHALTYAISHNNVETVKALIDAGGDVNAVDRFSKSPLIYAAIRSSKEDFVRVLIDAGANINYKNSAGRTALHFAVNEKRENNETLKALLDARIDINAKSDNGITALHEAVVRSNNAALQILLKAGADVNIIDKRGNSSILYAVIGGKLDMVNELIKAGADINIKNESNISPLSSAVQSNRPKLVEILLKEGANIEGIDATNPMIQSMLKAASAADNIMKWYEDPSKPTISISPELDKDSRTLIKERMKTAIIKEHKLDDFLKITAESLKSNENISSSIKDMIVGELAPEMQEIKTAKEELLKNGQENLENILATCLPSLILKGHTPSMSTGLYKDRGDISPTDYLIEHQNQIAKLKKINDKVSHEEIAWRQADALMLLHASGEWSNIKEQQEAYQQFTGASPAETKSHNLTIEGLFNSVVTGKDLPNIPFEEDSPFKKPSSLISLTEGMSSFSDETIRELGATISKATKNRKTLTGIADIIIEIKAGATIITSEPQAAEANKDVIIEATEAAIRKEKENLKLYEINFRKKMAAKAGMTTYAPEISAGLDALDKIVAPRIKAYKAIEEAEEKRSADFIKQYMQEKATATNNKKPIIEIELAPLSKAKKSIPPPPLASASAIKDSLTHHTTLAVDTGIHGSVPTPRDKTTGRR